MEQSPIPLGWGLRGPPPVRDRVRYFQNYSETTSRSIKAISRSLEKYCRTPNNDKNNNDNDKNKPHLNFLKVTALENTEQGVGIRDKGKT